MKRFLIVAAFVALFFVAEPAFAQTEGGGTVQTHPSTGTLVAAALETVGYVSQARVLKDLSSMLERLGALIYLCCIFTAILSVAASGRYDIGLWLLVGPPIFFFLLRPHDQAVGGAEWQFGSFIDEKQDREKVLRGAGVTLKDTDKVSWFFHGYNVLVSDTVQQLVKLVTKEDIRKQMLFMTRQQIMDDLFSAEINKPDVEGLAAIVAAQCWRELAAARYIAVARRQTRLQQTPEYARAVKDYCELYEEGKNRVYFAPGPARAYVVDLLKMDETTGAPDRKLQNLTCNEVWGWLAKAVQTHARKVLGDSMNARVNPQSPVGTADQILNDIKVKMESQDKLGEQPAAAGPSPCAGTGAAAAAPAPSDDATRIQLMITAWLLRKVFSNDPRGQMISQFAEHSGIQLQPLNYYNFQDPEAAFEMTRRFRQDRLAEVTRYEVFTLAMTLPYIQGVGLYLLATLFPFFALMVLVPGQAGSFFMWCALWVWLKCWDVGWALVMVADELLWSLMPHSSYFRLNEAGDNPITIFEAAFAGDYGYSLATYYMLVAAMVTAVPIISANAVIGSKKAIAGLVVEGLKSMATNFSAHVGDLIPPEQLQYVDRRRENAPVQQSLQKLIRETESMQETQSKYDGEGTFNSLNARGEDMMANLDHTMANLFSTMGPNESASRQRMQDEYQAHRRAITSQQSKNKVTAMANAQVRIGKNPDGSDKTERLGELGALMEIAHQGGMKPENMVALGRQAAASMGIEWDDNSLAGQIASGSVQPDFVDSDFRNPLTVDFSLKKDENGNLVHDSTMPVQLQQLRRQIEYMESMGDYYKGMASLVAPPSVAGAAVSPLAGYKGLGQANDLYQAGLAFERKASQMRADYLDRVSRDYYFQGGASDEWIAFERVRAGISLRGEWWNVPDAPQANRAGADLAIFSAQQEAQFITGKLMGNTFMNVTSSKP